MFQLQATPIGERTVSRLRGPVRKAYEERLSALQHDGCRAAAYRLSGEFFDAICVCHLWADYRLLVAFPDFKRIVVVLVGQHDNSPRDVYRILAELCEVAPPDVERTKPACCDDANDPPLASELLDRIAQVSRPVTDEIRRRVRSR